MAELVAIDGKAKELVVGTPSRKDANEGLNMLLTSESSKRIPFSSVDVTFVENISSDSFSERSKMAIEEAIIGMYTEALRIADKKNVDFAYVGCIHVVEEPGLISQSHYTAPVTFYFLK